MDVKRSTASKTGTLQNWMYDGEPMKKRLEAAAQKMPLSQTMQALAYMEKAHAGQLRRTGNPQQPVVPYAIHPLSLAVHALALGITDDDLLSAALLHDVCEDCDIACADLPFSRNVQEIVSRLTKDAGCAERSGKEAALAEYFENLQESPEAMLIKLLDRVNNLASMSGCFSKAKMREYIEESERRILPMAEPIRAARLEWDAPVFLLEYQMVSLITALRPLVYERL